MVIFTPEFLRWLRGLFAAGELGLVIGPVADLPTESAMATTLAMLEGQRAPLQLDIRDDQGQPAAVDGVPEWDLTGPPAMYLKLAPDGMSGYVYAPHNTAGAAVLRVKADADLGAGVRTITRDLDITVSSRGATDIEINPGAPEDIPEGDTPPAPPGPGAPPAAGRARPDDPARRQQAARQQGGQQPPLPAPAPRPGGPRR